MKPSKYLNNEMANFLHCHSVVAIASLWWSCFTAKVSKSICLDLFHRWLQWYI